MKTARTSTQHPIRAAELHVFSGMDAASGRFIGKFSPYKTYPMFFIGASAEEVMAKAEQFRAEVISKHEAKFAARAQARDRSQAARMEKGAKDG